MRSFQMANDMTGTCVYPQHDWKEVGRGHSTFGPSAVMRCNACGSWGMRLLYMIGRDTNRPSQVVYTWEQPGKDACHCHGST